jgi:mannose-6-phosphate isomerase
MKEKQRTDKLSLLFVQQNDPWGKKGHSSLAARLCSKIPGTDFKIEEDKFYSEVCNGSALLCASEVLAKIKLGMICIRSRLLMMPLLKMWMGTYPSVPSYVISTGESLQDFLKKRPDLIGESVVNRFGPDLPFLPKVS